MAKPMTSEYKVAFAITILLAILTFVFGAMSGRVGPSFLVWCYLSWLTYKRESVKLESWFKFIFIIISIAGVIVLLLNLFGGDGDAYGAGMDRIFDCLIIGGISYWLKNFHAKQVKK